MAELDGGNPVFYGGSSDSGGHAFVLDGYTDNGYFHVNWGWSGYCNGYFLLSALNPDGQGAGGSAGGYNNGQDALVGLKRDEGGEWTVSLGFEAYEDPEDGTVYRGLSTDPAISGSGFSAGSVQWGDGRSDKYSSGLTHIYSGSGEYTVVIGTCNPEEITFNGIGGITDIDLSSF